MPIFQYYLGMVVKTSEEAVLIKQYSQEGLQIITSILMKAAHHGAQETSKTTSQPFNKKMMLWFQITLTKNRTTFKNLF